MNVISVFHLQEQVSLRVMTPLIITGIIILSGSQVYTVNIEYSASESHQGGGGKKLIPKDLSLPTPHREPLAAPLCRMRGAPL